MSKFRNQLHRFLQKYSVVIIASLILLISFGISATLQTTITPI